MLILTSQHIAHVTILVARKDGLSYEEFENLYRKHVSKAVPVLKKYGPFYYNVVSSISHIFFSADCNQQFNSPASNIAARQALGIGEETAKVVLLQEHDAITTIKFSDIEGVKQLLESHEMKEVLDVDAAISTSRAKRRISLGTAYLAMEAGKSLI